MASGHTFQSYLFVNEFDRDKRHKARVHIARESHWTRRQLRKAKHTKSVVTRGPRRPEPFRWPLSGVVAAACPGINVPIVLTAESQCLIYHCGFLIKARLSPKLNFQRYCHHSEFV